MSSALDVDGGLLGCGETVGAVCGVVVILLRLWLFHQRLHGAVSLLEYHVVSAVASERILRLNTTRQLHLLDVIVDGLVVTILDAHRLPVLHALRVIFQLSNIDLLLLLVILVHTSLSSLENIIRLLLGAVDLLGCVPQVTQHFTVAR